VRFAVIRVEQVPQAQYGQQRTAGLIALPHDLADSVRAITVSEEEKNQKTHIPNQAKSGNAKRQLHE
jgi:hypothetical protein